MPEPAATVRAALCLPWGAWHGDVERAFEVPGDWQLVPLRMADAPAMAPDAIDRALDAPIAAPPLAVLARGTRRVAIAVDDLTRPTDASALLAPVVARLSAAGVRDEAMTIVIASGAHRPPTPHDIARKIGPALAGRLAASGHDPHGDLQDTGVELAGVRVRINRRFMEADLRIGLGAVMPHPFAGFSGGGKVVLPGLADLDVLARSHKFALMGLQGGSDPGRNRFRAEMERAVRAIGLDWTINAVVNSRRQTASVASGDLVEAHRAAAKAAAVIGATQAPGAALDALVLNAYPKDTELLQIEAAFVALRSGMLEWLTPEAPIVLCGACPEGLGEHGLLGPGGRLFRVPSAKGFLAGRRLVVFAPAVTHADARTVFWEGYSVQHEWTGVVEDLRRTMPRSPRVGFVACGPLQAAASGASGDPGRKEPR